MSVRLVVDAPPDLSVGKVTVRKGELSMGSWMATPTKRTTTLKLAGPGRYTAFVEALGQQTRTFSFDVRSTTEARVAVPSLEELATRSVITERASDSAADVEPASATAVAAVPLARRRRALTVAVAQAAGEGAQVGWLRFEGAEPMVTLQDGVAEFVLEAPSGDLSPDGSRLRLELMLAGRRRERLMVPLYAGGVRVLIRAIASSSPDASFMMVPVDLRRRAIVQALYAGTVEVGEALLAGPPPLEQDADTRVDDPWTVIASDLLAIRMGRSSAGGVVEDGEFQSNFGWIADAGVLAARGRLRAAGLDPAERALVAGQVIDDLHKARRAGRPYFRYAAQLASEMLGAIAQAGLGGASDRAAEELVRWQRLAGAHSGAGASHSWRVTGARRAGPRSVDQRTARVLLRAWLEAGRIDLRPPEAPASTPRKRFASISPDDAVGKMLVTQPTFDGRTPSTVRVPRLSTVRGRQTPKAFPRSDAARAGPPALRRAVVHGDDPWKDRFGRRQSREGFVLRASFDGAPRRTWVNVTVRVEAEEGRHVLDFDEPVVFYLHDSFEPDRLRAKFRGGRAKVDLVCYGGFTVGAWLPRRGIELELDLALMPDAPQVIRDY